MPDYYTGTDNSQQVRNYKTATGYYSGAVSGIPITSASLTPTPAITLPQPPPDKTDYMTGIAGTSAQIAEGMKTDATDKTDSQTDLQKMLASITTPSSVDAYNAAGTSLGIDTAQADALAARRAKRAAQSELAGIQGQVQAVVDRATAENLKLEQNINVGSTGVGGAGALASSSFLNVRQQEVNRQAAITALPLQALALAAQAKVASLTGEEEYAQSTLKAAQDKLNTVFKLWAVDADRKQTLQLKMLDIVIAQGNKKEAARAEALKEITARNQSDLKDSQDFAQSQSVIAKDSGQMDIAAKFAQLTPPDPTRKTFTEDLATYNAEVAKLMGKIKPKAASESAPTSYKEWELAGKPGTYADWLKERDIKAPTIAQQTVAEYAARLEQANPIIEKLTPFINGMNVLSFEAQLRATPSLQSAEIQQYKQAASNFINAKLRRESGAVISPSEFTEARSQYLPVPGDKPETLAQKKANRDLVYASLRKAAGNAYESVEDLMKGVCVMELMIFWIWGR